MSRNGRTPIVVRFADHIVAVPVPLILKGGVGVASLALHVQMSAEDL